MKYTKILGMALALTITAVGCTTQAPKADDMKKDSAMAEQTMDKDSTMTEDSTMEDSNMKEDGSKEMMSDEKSDESAMMTNKGISAPDFELTDLEGNVHKLSDYKGEKLYVKYWASWCSICLAGMDELNTLAGEDNDFKVITIVSPGAKGEKKTEEFKEWFSGLENTENVTVLLDEGGDIAKKYNVRGFPTSAYIGSDSVLVKTQPGHNDNDLIKKSFEAIH